MEAIAEIKVEARGKGSFGWDAWFQQKGSAKTYAEMSDAEKDRVSHRGDAYRKLAAHLQSEPARSAGRW